MQVQYVLYQYGDFWQERAKMYTQAVFYCLKSKIAKADFFAGNVCNPVVEGSDDGHGSAFNQELL